MAKIKIITLATLAAVSVAVVHSFASTQTGTQDLDKKTIEQSIKAQYPNTTIDAINQTPMTGIYEVVMGKNIAYTNSEGRYFMFGHLFDMQTQTDITAENKKAYAKIAWQDLSLDNALVFKKGNGERKFAMITDVDCGYCRMLEKELDQIDNVTIYKFLTPLQGGYSQSVSIWCSADRNNAYTNRIINGVQVPEKTCQNPIDDNLAFFESKQLTGTPTLIKPDGEVFQGYAQKSEIEEWLQ
ncbi:hypothetical protein MOVS_10840 (plasmid) [Moraxella ovis]|uniref:Thiol:disulfide interchange protein n=1 Tax=Moraxella ovis TaxID=29433 RepID=A0A378QDF4_9GAMM|nr:DsbC family protein [Moraxella ovis]ANB92577.1 hypothetical protein MOVS_10840 [Moraxella ovis]STY98572.1 Probable thiol:disulfide interchange protein DsbC precursor [Moraxella ovis]